MLVEISARATGFLGLAHIVGKFTRKGIIRLQVTLKCKVLFGRMSFSPHFPPLPITKIFSRKSLLANVTAQDTGSLYRKDRKETKLRGGPLNTGFTVILGRRLHHPSL